MANYETFTPSLPPRSTPTQQSNYNKNDSESELLLRDGKYFLFVWLKKKKKEIVTNFIDYFIRQIK